MVNVIVFIARQHGTRDIVTAVLSIVCWFCVNVNEVIKQSMLYGSPRTLGFPREKSW